jgi:4-deoxy-L-threo-5-hexosulose-uronate ketol-isomerase
MATIPADTIPDMLQRSANGGEMIVPIEIRHARSEREVQQLDTLWLRKCFLLDNVMKAGMINSVYSHYDRIITGGAVPLQQALELPNYTTLKSEYFLERRELGIINVSGDGYVTADGQEFLLRKLDGVYLGKGTQSVLFKSVDPAKPAVFYFVSATAHQIYPSAKLTSAEAEPIEMGSAETANQRIVYKYIHKAGLSSCQLTMGLTRMKPGSVWNTMPAHVHDRRTEVYFYFDVNEGHRVFHFMGLPSETRHLMVANHQAVLSPPWSIHAGCGTSSYSFIWAMAGENSSYMDMDQVAITELL